ncbi:iron ABC transporter permease [Halomonas sp. McH1-25]|uniref:FecCD family ABC transporter permease n=1 Tax=unclassified Halomonas TaxID=2609666 RepID=UPI001EF5299D|nr:iron ABC transporter permease [Halomonas sp. McH1-25]MCP1342810.1 iron ABC transporter permease [Halomonas sp. FL8]MCP1360880.1 iron ABC transporter permease [Halomonas sp. BBD45]
MSESAIVTEPGESPDGATRHRRRVLWGFALLLLVALGVAAFSGSVGLSPRLLLGELPSSLDGYVWWQLRLPRLLAAVLIGAILAASGTAMQGLFRNPLADPTLLGIASGAGLAVSVWIVLLGGAGNAWGLYGQFVAGFLGALGITVLVFALGRRAQGGGTLTALLLTGLVLNTLASAAGGLLAFIANDEQLRQLSLWGMGTLAHSLWPGVIAALLVIPPTLVLLLRSAHGLDLLQLGEFTAFGAGLDTTRLRRGVIVATALGVGLSVALAGIIGFLGLLVPHTLRLWLGPGHRLLMPASMLGGALLLVITDTLARTLASPAEIPVGLLTSLVGGTYFLWLLLRRQIH